jgi:hypothetical protein
MTGPSAGNRLALLAWVAVFGAAVILVLQTAAQIHRIGLVGARPSLSAFQTCLRIVIVVAAVVLAYLRRGLLERVTLLVGAAAAGSSALYGFGLRSPALSAFRLLSHLAAYALAAIAAGRLASRALRQRRDRRRNGRT